MASIRRRPSASGWATRSGTGTATRWWSTRATSPTRPAFADRATACTWSSDSAASMPGRFAISSPSMIRRRGRGRGPLNTPGRSPATASTSTPATKAITRTATFAAGQGRRNGTKRKENEIDGTRSPGEPDPAPSCPDTKPERERHQGDQLVPDRVNARFVGEGDLPPDREAERNRQRERRDLHPERRAVIALHRLRQEQPHARDEHHRQAADEPGMRAAREVGDRLAAQAQAEHPQVDDEHGAANRRESQQVNGLDHRERPQRLPDGVADGRRLAPLTERKQHPLRPEPCLPCCDSIHVY